MINKKAKEIKSLSYLQLSSEYELVFCILCDKNNIAVKSIFSVVVNTCQKCPSAHLQAKLSSIWVVMLLVLWRLNKSGLFKSWLFGGGNPEIIDSGIVTFYEINKKLKKPKNLSSYIHWALYAWVEAYIYIFFLHYS